MNLPCNAPPEVLKAAKEALALMRAGLAERKPALTGVIYDVTFVFTTAVATMAMTKRAVCLVNPHFVVSREKNRHGQNAIEHELWHLLRDHFGRSEDAKALNPTITDMELNQRQDDEINDDILDAGESFGPDMDDGVCHPKRWGAPSGLTFEQYLVMHREKQAQQKPPPPPPQPSKDDSESNGQPSSSKSDAKGDSQQDGDKGDDEGDKPGDGDESNDGHGSEDTDGKDAQGSGGFGKGSCGSAAGNAVEAEAMLDPDLGKPEETLNDTRARVAAAIVEDAKNGRGKYPADVMRWAEKLTTPSKVRWQTVLPRLVRNALTSTVGSGTTSYLQPSRRQAGLGYGNGRPVLPGNRQPTPEVQVWADTSGSMGSKELGEVLVETEALLRTVPGKVTFGACDAKVQAVKKVTHIAEVAPLVKGGGGTNFIPLFEHAESSKPRPDVVVVLTDGMATLPPKPPAGMAVVWVLIGKFRVKTMPWGKVIDTEVGR